jgi:hypothetical protein
LISKFKTKASTAEVESTNVVRGATVP